MYSILIGHAEKEKVKYNQHPSISTWQSLGHQDQSITLRLGVVKMVKQSTNYSMLDKAIIDRYRIVAAKHGVTMKSLINAALLAYIPGIEKRSKDNLS